MNNALAFIYVQIVIVNKILQAFGIKSLDRVAFGRRPPMLRFSLLRLLLLPVIDAVTIATAAAERTIAVTASRTM